MLWTDSQQKYFFCVDAFFLLRSGRAEKFDLSGLESAVSCSPRGFLGRQWRGVCVVLMGAAAAAFITTDSSYLLLGNPQAPHQRPHCWVISFFHLCHPGKVSFHSAMSSGSFFITLWRCGEKWYNRDLEIPFPTESLKLTFSRDKQGWKFCSWRICCYLFMSLRSVSFLSRFRYLKIMYLCSYS